MFWKTQTQNVPLENILPTNLKHSILGSIDGTESNVKESHK